MVYKPARKIKPKAKGYRGKEPFLTTGEMIPWDSFLERDYIRLADFDGQISEIQSQSECIRYLYGGKIRKYYTDHRVITNTNNVIIVEVKPLKFTQKAENKVKFAAARLYCEEKGWSFIVMTEVEIRPGWLQSNLAKLRGLGTLDVTDAILDLILNELKSIDGSYIDGFRERFSNLTDEEYYSAVYQLIYFQEIYTDLIGQPLDGLSRISVRKE